MLTSFTQHFKVALRAAVGHDTLDTFDQSAFFKSLYLQDGKAHFFLFKKNLRVTNLQFAELLGLIRAGVRNSDGTVLPPALRILTNREFTKAFERLVRSFEGQSRDDAIELIASLYAGLVRTTVLIRPFRGSCIVFLPPTLKLDVRELTAYAGYIHSSGMLVFSRSIDRTSAGGLKEGLRYYLDTRNKPIHLATYSHEDNTEDFHIASDLVGGLQDLKFHVDKFYLQGDRLADVINDIRDAEEFSRLIVLPRGDNVTQREKLTAQAGTMIDGDSTLWLIVDHALDAAGQANKRHFILYEQQWINANPLHIFDEHKPAWVAPITIPHTMIGAMLNITKPYWPQVDRVKIADPFVGTGTTWLEASKYPNAHVVGSDWDDFAPTMAADNAWIVTLDKEGLEDIRRFLQILQRAEALVTAPRGRSAARESYMWAMSFLGERMRDRPRLKEFVFTPDEVKTLKSRSRNDRLVLYLIMKALIKSSAALSRTEDGDTTEAWSAAFKKEVDDLDYRLKELHARPRTTTKALYEYQGTFSKAVAPRLYVNKATPVSTAKAEDLPANTYDVIIADPPYGFNTDENPMVLARTYSESLTAMIRALRPHGQLVLALPERSYIGRNSPFFTHKEIVTQQVMHIAAELERRIVDIGRTMPSPNALFAPPYYWESERALRRTILHFQFEIDMTHPRSTLSRPRRTRRPRTSIARVRS